MRAETVKALVGGHAGRDHIRWSLADVAGKGEGQGQGRGPDLSQGNGRAGKGGRIDRALVHQSLNASGGSGRRRGKTVEEGKAKSERKKRRREGNEKRRNTVPALLTGGNLES